MSSLATLEALALAYSEKNRQVAELIETIQREVEAVHSRHREALQQATAESAGAKAALERAVRLSPEIFAKKPRTRAAHEVLFGMRRGRATIAWDDESALIRRIRRLGAARSHLLLHTEIHPNKPALIKLPAAELAKLRVKLIPGEDEVVVRLQQGEAEKQAALLLEAATPPA